MVALENIPDAAKVKADESALADDAEPTKAEILADLREALKEALAGKGRPAREALAELRRKIENDADAS